MFAVGQFEMLQWAKFNKRIFPEVKIANYDKHLGSELNAHGECSELCNTALAFTEKQD